MKSLSVKLVFVLIILGLTICYGEARAADWKQFAETTTGIFQYDAAGINSTPEGFRRVWVYNVTEKEASLVELNCTERKYHALDVIQYAEDNSIKSRESYYDNPVHKWFEMPPKSILESLSKIVCP